MDSLADAVRRLGLTDGDWIATKSNRGNVPRVKVVCAWPARVVRALDRSCAEDLRAAAALLRLLVRVTRPRCTTALIWRGCCALGGHAAVTQNC